MSIRVAIAGVGNCASSLVQGVEYYKDAKDDEKNRVEHIGWNRFLFGHEVPPKKSKTHVI